MFRRSHFLRSQDTVHLVTIKMRACKNWGLRKIEIFPIEDEYV